MSDFFRGIKGIRTYRDRPLARYTSLGIGGPADYLVLVDSRRGLGKVLTVIQRRRLRKFVIGCGTNLLVSDRGFRGVVIKLAGGFRRIQNHGDLFICGAAVTCSALAEYARRHGYGGAEFMFGIPGTIGGAVKGNAGAWGENMAGIVTRAWIVDRHSREQSRSRTAVRFSYRHSGIADEEIITAVEFRLIRRDPRLIRRTMADHLRRRSQRQPPGRSAGSFFKNPPQRPAGQIIEECGLKGRQVGDAQVSMQHANFIINRGRARSSDVRALVQIIKRMVRRTTGIRLQEEVRSLP